MGRYARGPQLDCVAEKIPKNNERPRLFRVQDARAALPQNCSPKKIKWIPLPCLWHFRAISLFSIESTTAYYFPAPGAKNHFDAVSSVFRKFNNWADTLIRPTGFDGCVPSTSRSWQLHTRPSLRGIIPFAQ